MKNRLFLTSFFILLIFQLFSQESANNFTSDYFEQQRFAHRGGYANGPENTLNTILKSIKQGVKAIEIDAQLTKDQQLILFHDKQISRILKSESAKMINEISLAELKKIPLNDTTQGIQYVCSLEELVDTIVMMLSHKTIPNFIIEIDFKPHGEQTNEAVTALSIILDKHITDFGDKLYNHLFVSTFYPEVLKEFHQRNPQIITSLALHNSPNKQKLLANLGILFSPIFVRKYKPRIIEPNLNLVSSRFIKKWHKKGMLINAYTANTACEKRYMEQFQIAYTTNCPSGFCIQDPTDQMGKPRGWIKKCIKKRANKSN